MNKCLLHNLAYYQYQAIVLCSNNTKFYHNKIVYSIASLLLQCFGMPLALIKSIFLTNQSMKHIIRIAYGDSNISIDGKEAMIL